MGKVASMNLTGVIADLTKEYRKAVTENRMQYSEGVYFAIELLANAHIPVVIAKTEEPPYQKHNPCMDVKAPSIDEF